MVNLASMSALRSVALVPGYGAAKAGIVNITRNLAVKWAGKGIRVNAVLPGITLTPMISRLVGDENFKPIFDRVLERHPIGRFGQPSEIAESVKWLLSGDASFMNGAAVAVDGGYLAT